MLNLLFFFFEIVYGFWGTSTASYQVEGAVNEGNRGKSIWDVFAHTPGKTWNNETGDVADDFYHRYSEDIKLMSDVGFDYFRFSISWTRIMPDGRNINPDGVRFYNDLIDNLLEKNIEPFVTLFHWDLPATLQEEYNGFLSKKIIFDYANYAKACFNFFGDRVKFWITMNEPMTICINGYMSGDHAPGRCSDRRICDEGNSSTEPYICGHNLLLSHARAVSIYREGGYSGNIGMTINCEWPEPLTDSKKDQEASERAAKFEFGWFADPIFYGDYPSVMKEMVGDRLPTFNITQKKELKQSMDFFGLNHYSSRYVSDCPQCPDLKIWTTDMKVNVTFNDINGVPIGPAAASDWLHSVPWGIRKMLNFISLRYDYPVIYITENGCDELDGIPVDEAIDDIFRQEFLINYVWNVWLSWLEGVDVRGYFVWSLLDNFEWSQGYQYRFGLYYVNYTNNLTRIPKHSVSTFQNIIKNYTELNEVKNN